MPVVGPRFLIEAGFIIAVAVIAGIERLGTAWIVAVMAGAWLIVAAIEISVSRRRARERTRPAGEVPEVRPVPEVAPPPPLAPTRREPVIEARSAPEPLLEPKPEPPRIVAAPPPPPEPEPEPKPEPEPEPKPEPAAEPAPEAPRVVALPTAYDGPREWNLWELERIARDHASGDVARDEERSYLLMYLREFAGPDGVLPADFDGLVRDAFGDVLHTVGT